METPEQKASIAALEKHGFKWNFGFSDGSVIMKKKHSTSTTFYATVEADGLINGKTVKEFIDSFANEL